MMKHDLRMTFSERHQGNYGFFKVPAPAVTGISTSLRRSLAGNCKALFADPEFRGDITLNKQKRPVGINPDGAFI
jgi:hypothetical protein